MAETNTTPETTEKRVAAGRRKGRKKIEKSIGTLEKLEILYVPIDDIAPNKYNPNRQSDHDFELLLRSMEEDGFTQPIVAVRHEGAIVIVDGEHRWRAARTLGYEEIPVTIVPMTLEQARIATLRHNRARGSEDVTLAAEVLRDLEKMGAKEWALDSLMMDPEEFDQILADIPAPEDLAGAEWSNAWEPAEDGEDLEHHVKEEGREFETDGGQTTNVSASKKAADQIREREKRLQQARNDEERKMIRRDYRTHRVACTFSGDEADIVKAALGDKPAARILEWCIRHAEEQSSG